MTNFIFQSYIKDLNLCDEIIDYHKTSDNKHNGLSNYRYNPKVKDSTDVTFNDKSLYTRYVHQLKKLLDLYIEEYKYSNMYSSWGITENVNIQHYAPGQGFKEWHTERTTKKLPVGSRHLVFLTYLNDVNDCGETEFFYQQLKVKPQKGLTLIWPVEWTHTHRGIISPSEEKYIVTGWLNYLE